MCPMCLESCADHVSTLQQMWVPIYNTRVTMYRRMQYAYDLIGEPASQSAEWL
jgi:hypothetical protein